MYEYLMYWLSWQVFTENSIQFVARTDIQGAWAWRRRSDDEDEDEQQVDSDDSDGNKVINFDRYWARTGERTRLRPVHFIHETQSPQAEQPPAHTHPQDERP
jgi:hypothetical protein